MKCPECKQNTFKYTGDDSHPWMPDYYSAKKRYHCDWCGYTESYYYYKDGRKAGGSGWTEHGRWEEECKFPKTLKHCGKNVIVSIGQGNVHYYCTKCGAEDYIHPWQDMDRTWTPNDIQLSIHFDCTIMPG